MSRTSPLVSSCRCWFTFIAVASLSVPSPARAQQFHLGMYTTGSGTVENRPFPSDEAKASIQAHDGTTLYLSYARNMTSVEGVLSKRTQTGVLTWERSYGDVEFDSMVEAPSHDGYALLGRRRASSSSISPDFPVLVRVDASGAVVWGRGLTALDGSAQPACEVHANRISIDAANGRYVIVGDACSCSGSGLHCRPWIAEFDDVGNLGWIRSYFDAGEFSTLSDSSFESVAQANSTDLVAVGYHTLDDPSLSKHFQWPLVAVIDHATGVTKALVGYNFISTKMDTATLSDVTYDHHQPNSMRLVGTVYNAIFDCPEPGCGPSADRAFTGLVAVPSNPSGIGVPASWWTLEDTTMPAGLPADNYASRVVVAPNGDQNIFVGTTSNYFCRPAGTCLSLDHPVLIKASPSLNLLSGTRYNGACPETRFGSIQDLHWVPAGPFNGATDGLLMSIDYNYRDLFMYGPAPYTRVHGLLRSDLNGDPGGCSQPVSIRSLELDPHDYPVPYNVRGWGVVEWHPDAAPETPLSLQCWEL